MRYLLLFALALSANCQSILMLAGSAGDYTLAYGGELGRVESTAAGTTFATGAFVIPADTVVYLAVAAAREATADDATFPTSITGHGVTWNLIHNTNINSGTQSMAFYWTTTNAATASSALTFTYGVSHGSCVGWVGYFTGAHLTTPNVQFASDSTAGNIAITLGAITGAKNGVLCVDVELDTNGAWGTPEASWTEIDDLGVSNPACGMYVYYRVPTTDNSVAVTGSGANCAMAVEVGVRQ